MDFPTSYARATRSPHPSGRQAPFPYQVALASRRDPPHAFTVPAAAGRSGAVCLGWRGCRRFGPRPRRDVAAVVRHVAHVGRAASWVEAELTEAPAHAPTASRARGAAARACVSPSTYGTEAASQASRRGFLAAGGQARGAPARRWAAILVDTPREQVVKARTRLGPPAAVALGYAHPFGLGQRGVVS